MSIRKIARIVDAAMRDADRARTSASDPAFHRDVKKDRRAALSQFTTVKHALRDRARIERAKAAKKKKKK